MNSHEMVVFIVALVMFAGVMRARYKAMERGGMAGDSSEYKALEQKVGKLRDRVKVLERIAIEKEDTLTREIEQLRDR